MHEEMSRDVCEVCLTTCNTKGAQ